MSLVQIYSKQACRIVLHTMPFVLSAKQGSCEYHFLKPFGMTLNETMMALAGQLNRLVRLTLVCYTKYRLLFGQNF